MPTIGLNVYAFSFHLPPVKTVCEDKFQRQKEQSDVPSAVLVGEHLRYVAKFQHRLVAQYMIAQ